MSSYRLKVARGPTQTIVTVPAPTLPDACRAAMDAGWTIIGQDITESAPLGRRDITVSVVVGIIAAQIILAVVVVAVLATTGNLPS